MFFIFFLVIEYDVFFSRKDVFFGDNYFFFFEMWEIVFKYF